MRKGAAIGLLVVGCQFPRPADVPPDAGTDAAADAPTDARAELVFGRWDVLHTTPMGVTARGFDLSAFQVQALVPNGAGVTTVSGVGGADGSILIDNVPPGVPYYLQIGRLAFLTDRHEVQLGTDVPTRAGTVAPTSATPIDITLSVPAPFQTGDTVAVSSRLADSNVIFSPTEGTQTFHVIADWQTASANYTGTPGLPSAAAGDDLLAILRRTTPSGAPGEPTIEHIIAAADLTGTTFRDGEPTTVTATLAPPMRSFQLQSVNLSLYAAGHSPTTRVTRASVACAALPAAAVDWSLGGGNVGETIIYAFVTRASSFLTVSGMYPDPYPIAWPRVCSVMVDRSRALRLPSGPAVLSIYGGSQRVVLAAALGSSPMPPPQQVRIAGVDGESGGLIRNSGAPVTVTWTGSAQATQYLVSIYQIRPSGAPRLHVAIVTQDDHIDIPAESLTGVEFVAFQVMALTGQNDVAAGDLGQRGVPGGSASTTTAMFRWSSTCGNGAPDIGEDCDASGMATLTCDADCTTAMCGDGVRNVTAGELCDSIVDTPGCDSDCTANTCGDGHVNSETEQCDDGGTAPGDGCSATCTTE